MLGPDRQAMEAGRGAHWHHSARMHLRGNVSGRYRRVGASSAWSSDRRMGQQCPMEVGRNSPAQAATALPRMAAPVCMRAYLTARRESCAR